VGRLRILQTIHDFLPRHRAGSEIYAAELCRELAVRHQVTLLCAEYDPSRAHGQLRWRVHDGLPVVEVVNNWVCRTFADGYRSPELTARIGQVMDAIEPDVVHAHSFLNLSFDLAAEARRRDIPVVATLHDYSLVCPSGGQRLHRADTHVCHTIDTDRCVRCFRESPLYTQMAMGPAARAVAASGALQRFVGLARHAAPVLFQSAARAAGAARRFPVTEADITERLAHARRLFDLVDLFVAPSASIGRQFEALGLDPGKIRVSDYGFRPTPAPHREPRQVAHGHANEGATATPWNAEGVPAERRPLRIGFVGTLVWHKGVHILLEAVRRLPSDAYEVLLYGDTDVFPDYVADLRRAATGLPVLFKGSFDTSATGGIYSQFDVLVVPSLWLENSPLVVHEAFQAGVPVVGARMGGIADLVQDGINGSLFDANSPDSLARALEAVLANPACLDDWVRRLPAVKSIAQDALEWEDTYVRVIDARRVAQPA
jgi:glycosyltransferase involved in cell wall biosynthesis